MILMNDFRAEPAEIRSQMQVAARRVFESGWYVLGKECEAFEKAWSTATGVQHGVGVANGMDAIEIALRAIGVGPGDEVITTPMTAVASVLAIHRAGAIPVLSDIEPESALMSVASVTRCLSPRTRAILLVHLYGQIKEMGAWQALCAEHGIDLIEDCAQSHLARWGGRVAGSFGKAGAFSFYPTKNLGCIGDGGMLVTSDPAIAERSRMIRNYGQSERYRHPMIGLNSRLDEIQAAILSARLPWLAEFTERRRSVARRYLDGIRNPHVAFLAEPADGLSHVWHLFVVTTKHRDKLMIHLKERGVQSLIHYPVPVHHQIPYADLPRDPQGLGAAEEHSRTCLSLPCHPQLSDQDVERVIACVNGFSP